MKKKGKVKKGEDESKEVEEKGRQYGGVNRETAEEAEEKKEN